MGRKTRRLGGLAVALVAGTSLLAPGQAAAIPPDAPKTGIVCTSGAVAGNTQTFNLVAKTGYIQTPDGNSVFMWSYANGDAPDNGAFQSPGPVLCATQGQTVVVNLTNSLPAASSISFPGQDGVTSSGGAAGLLVREAAATGGTVSYSFTAGSPGTYLYESGTDVSKQVEMGLYGALVVRPSGRCGPGLRPRHPVRPCPGVPAAAQRDRPGPAPRRRGRRDLRLQRAAQPVLRDQRPRVPRHRAGQRIGAAAEPAVRLAGPDPAELGIEQPAGAGPDPQRRRAEPPVPPARQPHPPDRSGRPRWSRRSSEHFGETDRIRPDAGLPAALGRPGQLEPGQQPVPGHPAELPQPDVQGRQHLLQRQPLPRRQGHAAHRHGLAEPLR